MLTHKIQRHPIAVAMVILAGVTACAFALERMNLDNKHERVAEEESWERILPVPSVDGIYKFYDEPHDRVCWLVIRGQSSSLFCDSEGETPTTKYGIESIPQPQKHDKWGA